MSQHDYVIANDTAANVRADINSALAAIVSNNSGATEPATTYANQWWYDTANKILKLRTESDDAWMSVAYLDDTGDGFRILDDTQVVNTSGTQTGLIGDQSTATWEAGTGTTESLVSPAKVKAAIDALAGGGFSYAAVSGTTQALDVGAYNFFDAGTRAADTTISFTNVPTEAQWTYTAEIGALTYYDLTATSFVKDFSVAAQETSAYGLFFKPDGTAMYVCGFAGDDVNEYSLTTAWDISTASYVRSFSVSARETSPNGLSFKPDGTAMYVIGTVSDAVNEYSLSTAWDISTASYVRSFSVAAQDTSPYGLFFKPDGTAMYVGGFVGTDVNEYSLSTAWNVSTASYVRNFSVVARAYGLFFKPDGTAMYAVDTTGSKIDEYSLSTAWNVSTASYVRSVAVATSPTEVSFRSDGSVMYILTAGGIVHEYSVASVPTVTIPASVQNPPDEAYIFRNRASYTFFTADGGTTVNLIGEEVL